MIEPDARQTLDAVAHFLETELKSAIKDPSLAFRALIAAHLVRTAALEIPTRAPDPREAELAESLRRGALAPSDALEEIAGRLAEELKIVSPRFDVKVDP